eukprot:CAMPEP_0178581042 /NCGR_PEP_ID=MMETSP0697-20121206/22954_1 /TAXON_ID=265572 /ORGANISM="Extubocellulus spinifer, Strain CCMP396" /LENGTH=108 /DNA_ID=CAMNT_0020216629 /DNA_START=9 /DNA_END=335 /DNA_ORIENTATION=-
MINDAANAPNATLTCKPLAPFSDWRECDPSLTILRRHPHVKPIRSLMSPHSASLTEETEYSHSYTPHAVNSSVGSTSIIGSGTNPFVLLSSSSPSSPHILHCVLGGGT